MRDRTAPSQTGQRIGAICGAVIALIGLAGCTSGWTGRHAEPTPEPTLSELLRASEKASGQHARPADDNKRQSSADSAEQPGGASPANKNDPPTSPNEQKGTRTSANGSRSLLEVLKSEYGDDLQQLSPQQRARLLAVAAQLETAAPLPTPSPATPNVPSPATSRSSRNDRSRVTETAAPVRASLNDDPPSADGGTNDAVQPAAAQTDSTRTSSAVRTADHQVVGPSREAELQEADRKWQELVEQAAEKLRRELDDEDAVRATTKEERARREVLLRLLRIAAGDGDAALDEFRHVDGPEADYWRDQLFALHLATDPNRTPVLSQRAARLLEHLRGATQQLAAVSALDLKNPAFCRNVYGFADLEEFRPYTFRADQEVLLYVELDNFAVERIEAGASSPRTSAREAVRYETDFRGSYQIVDRDQRRVADQKLPRDKQTCPNARRDYFIAYRIYMPKEIEPGPYTLQLTIEDVKGRKFGQAFLEFEIVP